MSVTVVKLSVKVIVDGITQPPHGTPGLVPPQQHPGPAPSPPKLNIPKPHQPTPAVSLDVAWTTALRTPRDA